MSSGRSLLCIRLPSAGITRFPRYYADVRLPGLRLVSSFLSLYTILVYTRETRLSLVDCTAIVIHDWLCDPAKATVHSHSAYCDVAFRMDKLRRPLRLCKLSGLTSIATLHPDCLRLTLAVTRQRPRLANGGLLGLAVWEFHPLSRAPFQGALTLLHYRP